MKAIRIHEYGLSDVLRYEEAPVPEIKENQVLVKVYATSINHLDLMKASGAFKNKMELNFPWIPGHDFAGTIENIGFENTDLKRGDAVYGNCMGGSFAEYVAVDLDKVALKPENLTFIEAASVPHVAETAWQAIHTHGQLKKGQRVLIHGAVGAVGAYAVQFAHLIGAEVYTSASGQDNDLLKSLGADVTIDYKTTDFTTIAHDIDLVLVFVGGDIQKKSYSVLKKGGRIVSTTGPIMEEEAKRHEVTGISMIIRQSAIDLKQITDLLNACDIRTDVAATYALPDAIEAWKLMGGEDPANPQLTHGKIVLEVLKEIEIPIVE